jgi:hypothetical protein
MPMVIDIENNRMQTNIQNGKAESFERIASRRTADILKKLKLLGNLSNRNNYSYSDDQIKQMFSAIDRELKLARDRFNVQTQKREPVFRFSKQKAEA